MGASDVAADHSGNRYVTSRDGRFLVSIDSSGRISLLAGSPSSATGQSFDGTGSDAAFGCAAQVVCDSKGNIFVTDLLGNTIREVTPSGVVTTIAGMPGESGLTDGVGRSARFYHPYGLAIDAYDNLYVGDIGNGAIRKITPSGIVSTFYHLSNSSFPNDRGLAVDQSGQVFLAYANCILKITASGKVSIFAGGEGAPAGSLDGVGTAARFNQPKDLAFDKSGYLYVADQSNYTIRKISPAGYVSTIAGHPLMFGCTDGDAMDARFMSCAGLTVDDGDNVFVADNYTIRKITPTGIVSTAAGLNVFGFADGNISSSAHLGRTRQMVFDDVGNLYLAGEEHESIRKIARDGTVSTIAGKGFGQDETGAPPNFLCPYGIVRDIARNVFYVSDTLNHTIHKLTPEGQLSKLAGKAGAAGFCDGQGENARFYFPKDLVIDRSGNIYVIDQSYATISGAIRKITPQGDVTTLSIPYEAGPSALAIDANDTLYTALQNGSRASTTIVKILPNGELVEIAGAAQTQEILARDGQSTDARFTTVDGITVDSHGNIYVINYNTIRLISPERMVTTVIGEGAPFATNSDGAVIQDLSSISGLLCDTKDNLLFSASNHPCLRASPFTRSQPVSPKLEWRSELGHSQLGGIAYGSPLSTEQLNASASIDGTFSYTPAVGTVLDVGNHTLSVVFTPTDRTNYTTSTAQISLAVVPATPVIKWDTPSPIALGTVLSSAQLNATTDIPGTFQYSHAIGEKLSLGLYPISVSFTPVDTTRYKEARATINLQVILTSFAGTYRGSLVPSGLGSQYQDTGFWMMVVQPDNSANLFVYNRGRKSTIIASGSVATDGKFTFVGREILSSETVRDAIRFSGTISNIGRIADGQVIDLEASFYGIISLQEGAPNDTSGLYTANDGHGRFCYLIFAPNAEIMLIAITPSGVDGASGYANNLASDSASYKLTIDSESKAFACKVIPFYTPTTSEFSGFLGTLSPIITQTGDSIIQAGKSASFSVYCNKPGMQYRWQISHDNGATWSDLQESESGGSTTTETLVIANCKMTMSGVLFRCIIAEGGTYVATSTVARLTVSWSQFSALSVRAPVGLGNQTLLLGFVYAGGSKPTLIRGVGPSLAISDVSLAGQELKDPQLTLLELQTESGVARFTPVATNDNWSGTDELRTNMRALGMGPLDDNSSDAALLRTPAHTICTAQISGIKGGTGVALAEVYDANFSDKEKRLTALSVRNQVGLGAAQLIAGFVISGDAPKRVIIRGVGPGLLANAPELAGQLLENPTLQLNQYTPDTASGWTIVDTNDDWVATTELTTAMSQTGMGPLAFGSKDAVLLLELQPGIYTAQMRGVGETTGIGLVEIYEIP